jgi:Cu+-exporting ATPase
LQGDHQVYVLKNDSVLATFDLSEEIRTGAAEMISFFKSNGIKTVLISGDKPAACNAVAKALGIDEVRPEMLPHEKAAEISRAARHATVAMVGDGINDAPSLANAHVSVSFGSATQVAMANAGIIIMNASDLNSVARAFRISKAALLTIKQNLFWALIYNVIAIPVAAAGYLSPIIGSLSMAFSDVVVIGNSLRLRIKNIFDQKTGN